MLRSSFFIPTLRENPKDAEIISHSLLIRSGCIRQVASGIYSFLPFGFRVLQKILDIVADEMDKIGANRLLFPFTQPSDLWISSGRWDIYGKELLRFKDRLDRDFVLAPTHEEICVATISQDIHSYKALPLTVYQIHWKFRDELRPRYGLLRGREFLMKDAYSFHDSYESLDNTYSLMYKAYSAIFSRLSLEYVSVDADTGSIGGAASHEFMVKSDIGEDTIVSCSHCTYAANLEKAEALPKVYERSHLGEECDLTLIDTPNITTIEDLSTQYNIESYRIIKSLAYIIDTKPVLVCVRGDRVINELKLKSYLQAESIEKATDDEISGLFSSCAGFLGPYALPEHVLCIIDNEIDISQPYTIGANRVNTHYTNYIVTRDCSSQYTHIDIREVVENDLCIHCSSPLSFSQGIEVGHIFKLGVKYSKAMNANFLNENGKLEPFIMGCYGIGVSRLLSAVIEQFHDEKGIIFPLSIAPFLCTIITLDNSEEIVSIGEKLYRYISTLCDVLYDDRNERAGVKLNDADLLGIPLQIIIGKKGYKNGCVECKVRGQATSFEIRIDTFEDDFITNVDEHYPDFIKYCNK